MTTIALYNLKGGVGKTAGCINLAYLAARDDDRCLVWDVDPQGASSFYLNAKAASDKNSKKLIGGQVSIEELIFTSAYPNLDIIPADISSRKLDLFIEEQKNSKKLLKQLLKPLKEDYDLVFIDCPPGFSTLAESIFNAADIVLMPTIPTTLSLRSFDAVKDFFAEKQIDPSKLMCFFSMVDGRKALHNEVMEEFSQQRRFFQSVIPYLSDIEKMGVHQAPLPAFAPNSKGTKAYRELWEELKEGIF